MPFNSFSVFSEDNLESKLASLSSCGTKTKESTETVLECSKVREETSLFAFQPLPQLKLRTVTEPARLAVLARPQTLKEPNVSLNAQLVKLSMPMKQCVTMLVRQTKLTKLMAPVSCVSIPKFQMLRKPNALLSNRSAVITPHS